MYGRRTVYDLPLSVVVMNKLRGTIQDERGCDYLGNHVLADPRVVTGRSRSNTPPHEEVREVQYVGR